MLQQSAHKSVMHALCRRMSFERFDKSFIFHKIAVCKLLQIRILDFMHIREQLFVHLINVSLADRQIIFFDIFAFSCFSYSFDGNL